MVQHDTSKIIPVISPRSGRVKNFQRWVTITKKDGTKGQVLQFLPEKSWPTDAQLQRAGLGSRRDVRDENLKDLSRGRRAGRRRGGRSRSKSRSRTRSTSRKSKSRKGRRSSKSQFSAKEKRFLKAYERGKGDHMDTTKKLRESMVYEVPKKRGTQQAKINQLKKEMQMTKEKIKKIMNTTPFSDGPFPSKTSELGRLPERSSKFFTADGKLHKEGWFRTLWAAGLQPLRSEVAQLKRDLRDYRLSKYIPKVDRGYERARLAWQATTREGQIERQLIKLGADMSEYSRSARSRPIDSMGASVTRASKKSKSRKRRGRKSSRKSRSRKGRKSSRKSRSSRKGRKSSRKSSRGKRRSYKSKRRSRGSRKSRHSKGSRKSRKSRRSSRKSRRSRQSKRTADRLHKKNLKLLQLMRKEFGRVLSQKEYDALPSSVRRELQLEAYEGAYPGKVKLSPDSQVSNKELHRRRSRSRGKGRSRKSSVSKGKKQKTSRRERKSSAMGKYDTADVRRELEKLYPAARAKYEREWGKYKVTIDPKATKQQIIDLAANYYRPGQAAFALQEAIHRHRIEH